MRADFEQIFISYARSDEVIAAAIDEKLVRAGIPVWRDVRNLAGSPNFEAAIREAIEHSCAVVFLASPDARASSFVQGELTLAKACGVRIISAWIRGDRWEDCVPMDMLRANYLDCRERALPSGTTQLVQLLYAEIDAKFPPHRQVVRPATRWGHTGDTMIPSCYTLIHYDDGAKSSYYATAAVRARSYRSVRNLVNDVYSNYLRHMYSPYSYGEEWVMVIELYSKIATELPVLPYQWLQTNFHRRPLSQFMPDWPDRLLERREEGLYVYGHWVNSLLVRPLTGTGFFASCYYMGMSCPPRPASHLQELGLQIDVPLRHLAKSFAYKIDGQVTIELDAYGNDLLIPADEYEPQPDQTFYILPMCSPELHGKILALSQQELDIVRARTNWA